MQSVEIQGLRQVQDAFERLPEAVRQAKADVFEAVGKYLLEDVQNRIGSSGRVAGVQEYHVGSGKGYVAVRAKKETWLDSAAAGYVTNALENGHVQTPGGMCRRWAPGSGGTGYQANICTRLPGGARAHDGGRGR